MQKLVFPDHFPCDGKGIRNEEGENLSIQGCMSNGVKGVPTEGPCVRMSECKCGGDVVIRCQTTNRKTRRNLK